MPDKQLQGHQSLQGKFWASASIQKWVSRRGQFIKPELHDCRGKRGAGQVSPYEKRTQQCYRRSPAPIAPQIICPLSGHSACLLLNLHAYCMTTDFIKQGLHEKQRLYFTSLLLVPLLLKSSDNHSVSGCVGSCLTPLTCRVFCSRGLVLK